MNNSLYGKFRGPKFTDIWSTSTKFAADLKNSPLAILPDSTAIKLYYLLYARFGNSHIASFDVEQFKYKIYSTIFMYGPTWAKRLEIQQKLRELTEADLMTGGKAIYNHAYNPGTEPSTATLEELTAINDQNTTNYKKSKMEGYSLLLALLETDITKEFLDKFRPFFITVVEPEETLLYEMEDNITL